MPASFTPHRVGLQRWGLAVIVVVLTLPPNLINASDLFSTLRIQKCYCDKSQAWDGAQCHDNITSLIPIYLRNIEGTEIHVTDVRESSVVFPTNQFENVTVQDIQCSEGLFRTAVPAREALLLSDGRLLWSTMNTTLPQDSFCIVQFLESGTGHFDVHVCLKPPAVPRCCPANHLLGRDGSCYPSEALKSPSLLIGENKMDWDSLDGDLGSPICEEHEYHHHVPLRKGEGILRSKHPTAILEREHEVWTASQPWTTKYCVGMHETEAGELQYVAQICIKDYMKYHKKQCGASPCVRKCCLGDQFMYRFYCVGAFTEEDIWNPSHMQNQTINEEWKIVTGEPGCSTLPYYEDVHLLPNGYLKPDSDSPALPPSQYCLENILQDDSRTLKTVALLCGRTDNIRVECLWRDILIKVVFGVSCVFLVLTLVVYLGVAELREQMYGRCLISLVVAMLTAYLTHVVSVDENSWSKCYTHAFISQLTSLAMFFWLNVMCFDMWKILRGLTRQHHSMKVFLWYCVYAWGCPLVISIVTLSLDVTAPGDNLILPDFFNGFCWFNGNEAYWLYFSGFILVLVVINVGFFIHVAITLYKKMKQRTETFETGTSHTNKTTKSKQKVWLFVKLFMVMGVLWITDVLSAVRHSKTCTYWVLTDVINSLQGVFIFILAVCNKDNLKKIKDAWGPRFSVVRKTIPDLTSRRPTQTNTLSIDDLEESRKTSITSLPRKISQASSIFFSNKKSASLSPPPDSSTISQDGRKGSNVSVKDIIPLSTMQEENKAEK